MSFIPLFIEFRNFKSYGNNVTRIDLNFNKAVLFLGRNLDSVVEGQIDSNGAGKTTLPHGLEYVTYDKVIDSENKEVKLNDLINRSNGKNLQVNFEFLKDSLHYRIERFRKLDKGRGNGCILLRKENQKEEWNYTAAENGGHDITTTNVNAQIETIIGMPYEIFSRIITMSGNTASFLSLKLDEQRTVVEELFGFTELSQKAESLKTRIKNNNIELDTLVKLDEQIRLELNRHNEQLSYAKTKVIDWEKSKDAKVQSLKTKIKDWNDTYGGIDFDAEEQKFVTLQTLENDIVKEQAKIAAYNKDIATVDSTVTKIKAWDVTHAKDVANLKLKVDQPLIFKTVKETQAFDEAIKEYDGKITEINTAVIALDASIVKDNNTLLSLKKEIRIKEDNIVRLNKDVTKLEKDVTHLKDSKCPYCEQQYAASRDKIRQSEDQLTDIKNNIITEGQQIQSIKRSQVMAEERLVTLTTDRATKVDERKTIQSDKQSFMVDILGSADINLQTEYNKTINHQTLLNEYNLKVKQTNPHLNDITLEDLESSKTELQDELNNWQSVLDNYNAKKKATLVSLIFKQSKDIAPAKFAIDTLSTDLGKAEEEVNPHLDNLVTLENIVLPIRKTEVIQTLHTLIEHEDFLLKLLTKKDSFIRKALLNKYLPFLNTRIKHYLDKIGLPHRVEFLEDMSVKISSFKVEIPFSTYSSGQKARVNIALAFAMRELLISRFGNIPLIIADELIDKALGAPGVIFTTKMIKSIAKETNISMFLISHKDEISSLFDNRMVVELKNGYSNIVESNI